MPTPRAGVAHLRSPVEPRNTFARLPFCPTARPAPAAGFPAQFPPTILSCALPGSAETLRIYDGLDKNFRTDFESMIELLDRIVLSSIEVIFTHRMPDGSIEPDAITEICEQYSADLRAVLDRTADLVNHGYAPPLERPQHMADRLMATHSQHKNVG